MAGAVAAALFKRERTGQPSVVDVSLLGTALWMNATVLMTHANPGPEGPAMAPRDRRQPRNPLTNSYKAKDGRWIALVVIHPDPHWRNFCEHIGRMDLFDDARFVDFEARMTNAHLLVTILDEEFLSRTSAEWRKRLKGFTGVWDVNQTPAEVTIDPQVLANGYVVPGQDPGPHLQAVASPVQFDEQPLGPVPRAPEYGAHTDNTLLDAGYPWDEIIAMKVAGATL
jgi:crotonobetainyl-CoA:carnitine CoA-transferase CaiB-like acyl-CoA transferase